MQLRKLSIFFINHHSVSVQFFLQFFGNTIIQVHHIKHKEGIHIIFNIPVEAVKISPADGNVYVAPFCMGASGPGSEKDDPLNVVLCGQF